MPTYEYKCDGCGHAFEKFQSIKADAIKTCPVCGKDQVRRLISGGGGLIFKGSGFYITDYRDSGYAEKAKADKGSSGEKTDTAVKSDASSKEPAKATESKPAESKPAETKAAPVPAAKPASE